MFAMVPVYRPYIFNVLSLAGQGMGSRFYNTIKCRQIWCGENNGECSWSQFWMIFLQIIAIIFIACDCKLVIANSRTLFFVVLSWPLWKFFLGKWLVFVQDHQIDSKVYKKPYTLTLIFGLHSTVLFLIDMMTNTVQCLPLLLINDQHRTVFCLLV